MRFIRNVFIGLGALAALLSSSPSHAQQKELLLSSKAPTTFDNTKKAPSSSAMKLILAALILISVGIATAYAGNVILFIEGSGSGDAPQTTAFLARANAITTLDAMHTNAYRALINGGVADGWFQKMDILFIGATQSQGVAALNLPNATYTAGLSGGATFTANTGWSGNGVGGRVITTFNPTTATTPNFTQNSAHISAWNLGTTSQVSPFVGQSSSTTDTNIYNYTDGNTYGRVNDSPLTTGFATVAFTGLFVANRDGSTTRQLYRNAASLGTYGSSPSEAPLNAVIQGLTTITAANSNVIASLGAGGSLTSTDVSNYYARMRAYMTAVGVP